MLLDITFVYYSFIKVVFFFSLVRVQVRSDTMKENWLFFAILYTAAVAFLSWVFIMSWTAPPWPAWQLQVARNFGVTPWQAFLGETLLLCGLYFYLLSKFDEGVIFWTLLLLGIPVALF